MNKTVSMILATLMHVSCNFVMVACGNATPGDTEDTYFSRTLSVTV